MHMWFARMLESKTFLEDAFFFSWEKHCVMLNVKDKNPPYSDYQQRLEIILVILSFQRKSEHPVVVAKKTKHVWGVKIVMFMFVARVQSQFVWNVSQKLSKDYGMWFLQKEINTFCWYHVDNTSYQMLKVCSTTTSNVAFPCQLSIIRLLVLLTSLFEFPGFLFLSVESNLLRVNLLRSIDWYRSSCYKHSWYLLMNSKTMKFKKSHEIGP